MLTKSGHRQTESIQNVFYGVYVIVGFTHTHTDNTSYDIAAGQTDIRFTLMVSKQPCSSARTVTMSSMQPKEDKQHHHLSLNETRGTIFSVL